MSSRKIHYLFVSILFIFVLGVMPAKTVSADTVDSGYCGDNLKWTFDDNGTLTISGSGSMYDYDRVPIGGNFDQEFAPWRKYDTKIKTIVFSGNITSIGNYAFYQCSISSDIEIPDSVTTIGKGAFAGCRTTKLKVGNAKTIGADAFNNCQNLQTVILPDRKVLIRQGAFCYCSALKVVVLNIESDKEYAFDTKNYTGSTFSNFCYYYDVTYTNDGQGTISGKTRTFGTDVIDFDISHNSNNTLSYVTWKNGNSTVSLIPDDEGHYVMPSADSAVTINVSFKEKHIVTVNDFSNGVVSINNTANGIVSASKLEAGEGDSIKITAKPNTGCVLDTIKVNNEVFSGTSFTMPDSDVAIDVVFRKIDYTIAKYETTLGVVTPSKTIANYGDEISLDIELSNGYELTEVLINGEAITGTTFLMPNENVTIALRVKKKFYSITINETVNGTATTQETSSTMNQLITVRVNPDEGYELDTIKVNGETITGTSFRMPTEDVIVDVSFKKKLYNISVDSNISNGKVTPSKTEASIGDEITLTITPDIGYELNTIKVNDENITGTTFTMGAKNAVVSVSFKKSLYTITVNKTTNGTVTTKNTANYQTLVKINISPDDGYETDTIKVNGEVITDTQFSMPATNVIIDVTFKKIEYSIVVTTSTFDSKPCGTVQVSKTKANAGDVIKVTATPNVGFKLDGIYVNNTAIDGNEFTMGTCAANVHVAFSRIKYSVTIETSTGGSATATSSTGNTYYYGSKVSVHVYPEAGYTLNTIKVNGTVIDGTEFNMGDADVVVEVSFKKIEYTITVKTSEGGTAKVSKKIAYYGDEITITVIPNAGYTDKDVAVDGYYVNTVNGEYKFTMGLSDVTVTVSFRKIYYSIYVKPTDNGYARTSMQSAGVGDEITVTAYPNAGYELDYFTVNGVSKQGNKFTMLAEDVIVQAVFIKHDLTPKAAKAPTCTDDGYEAYYECNRCHKLFSDAEGTKEISKPVAVSKLGHSWDQGEVTKEPTCEEKGIKTFHCTREGCSGTKTEPISALGHKLNTVNAKEPTKDAPGIIKHYKCERCEKLFSDADGKTEITTADTVIEKLKHNLTAIPEKPATCTEDGHTAYYFCEDTDCGCGKVFNHKYGRDKDEISINDTVIRALGHNFKEVDGKDPTCTEAGYEKYYKCSRCQKLFSDADGKNEIEKPVAISKLGHDMKHVEAQKPTHSNDGNKEYYHCNRCGKNFADAEGSNVLTDAEIVIPHVGAAALGEEITEGDFIYKVTNPRTDGTGTVTIIGMANETESVSIPSTVDLKLDTYIVNRIGTKAFYGNKTIKTVTIGSNIVIIDSSAFYGCSNLTKVTGGKGLKTIGSSAFARCSKLKSFSITSPVLNKIGTYAFNKDSKLKTVYIKYTTKLTKSGVKKSLKGSKVKTVKVKKSKVKKYKKYFKKKNSGRSVKVKK